MSGFEKHSQADIVLLEKWIQFEAEEAQNDSKEAILLLDTHLIEQTFVYCVKFNTTPLAKHASVCLLATYLRAYYQCKNPSMYELFYPVTQNCNSNPLALQAIRIPQRCKKSSFVVS